MESGENLRYIYIILSLPYVLAYYFVYAVSPYFRELQRKVVNSIGELCYEFPPDYKYYLQIAEDHRGDYHYGIDQISFFRIIAQYAFKGIKQGGSTIEQQLVRTIIGHYEPTLKRKFIEQLLAISVARKFNKEQTISAYIQIAYLGTKISGVFELAKALELDVFRDSSKLSIELAIRLKYPEPSKYSVMWYKKYQRRKNHIVKLSKMRRSNFVHLAKS